MAAERQVRPWKSISISPTSYDMLEAALLNLVERYPDYEPTARKFASDNQLTRVIEHIDAMRNARRSSQLEMPT